MNSIVQPCLAATTAVLGSPAAFGQDSDFPSRFDGAARGKRLAEAMVFKLPSGGAG
jgi:hypothetical protein